MKFPGSETMGPVPLCPLTAVLCNIWTLVSAVVFTYVFYVGGLSPVYTADLQAVESHCGMAVMLVFSAFVLEAGFLWNGLVFSNSGQPDLEKSLINHRLLDSMLTLLEYVIKFVTGMYIWHNGGPVHTDLWAHGGHRPVFFARFAQWSVAVPVLILISNRAFLAELGVRTTILRSVPALVVTFWSVWLCWLMETTTVSSFRWLLTFVSAVGLFLPLADQLYLSQQCRHARLYKVKFGMLLYQIVVFLLYSCVFMAGRVGILSMSAEQVIYAYCDSTVKVLQGALLALIRSAEDSQLIHRWYGEAVSVKKDFDTIVKLVHVPVVTFLGDGTIIRVNEAAAELLNTAEKSVAGLNFRSLIAVEQQKQVFDQAVKDVNQGQQSSGLIEITSKSPYRKEEQYLLLNFVPVVLDGVKALVAIGQNLTELSELKAVEEKKSRLMAVVSHEIRSPLHGMIGLATSMIELVNTDKLKRQLGMVKSCSTRLLDLVTNVMDLSEAEARKDNPNIPKSSKVDFLAIAEEAVVMSRMAVDKANKPLIQKGVELKNRIAEIGKVPIVMGNHYKCTQLIYNLLTNACKFTKEGSVSVCAKHIQERSILEISVVDTGCGISRDAQERIFKPFEQEHSSSGDSRNFQGLGLGLAVCLDIVQMHNGSIRVESEVGKGSSFIVSLSCLNDAFCEELAPVQVDKEEDSGKGEKSPPRVAREETPQRLVPPLKDVPKRKRPLILSVDDCEVNQEIIKAVLANEYDLVCCMDGHSALEWLEKNRKNQQMLPDLILLDIQMPGMTGYDVCKIIRQHFEESITALPIMMLSATTASIAAIKSKEHGSSDFISKPFEKEFLKKKVVEALTEKDGLAPPVMPRQTTEDLSMDLLSARANVLEIEKVELEARALRAEQRAARLDMKLRELRINDEGGNQLRSQDGLDLKWHQNQARLVLQQSFADKAERPSELEYLHSEIVQRDIDIAQLESQLASSRASNQLFERRLSMQSRLNRMLHDTIAEGNTSKAKEVVDSASCRD
ncbi:unnamed protein product [Durusdinium trenchii]|uniref:histidine kinase n=1 Tax=Durusdinium trenchii TaxID=1381693 RepID=A0ABP0SGQ7_9DINO